jgi:hypothetical protein
MFILSVELETSYRQTVMVGENAKALYLKWQETGKDEDFELLASTIEDDVREQLDFWIEDITERIVSKK